ncbi:hypothetical protein LZ32DRAFT_221004 [Colletotrichum eremochloae]|nr:hypothetical protein LZ32DRAFT_221004 [Colletotrichum eremochloae]
MARKRVSKALQLTRRTASSEAAPIARPGTQREAALHWAMGSIFRRSPPSIPHLLFLSFRLMRTLGRLRICTRWVSWCTQSRMLGTQYVTGPSCPRYITLYKYLVCTRTGHRICRPCIQPSNKIPARHQDRIFKVPSFLTGPTAGEGEGGPCWANAFCTADSQHWWVSATPTTATVLGT